MKIPKIIHQTWKTTDIPNEYRGWVDSWKRLNPGFEYRLWTDDDNRNLIKTDFPEFLHFYDSLPLKIHRVDIIRYFILYRHGGVYADLDFECLKPIEPLLGEHVFVAASEPKEHCIKLYNNRPRLICNAWMASTPKHPFWFALIQEIQIRFRNTADVLELTGPLIMDDVFSIALYHQDVYQLYEAKSELLYPLYGSVKQTDKNRLLKDAYCAHHWKNSWTGQKSIGKQYDGFYFYSGQDSFGNDIHHSDTLDGAYRFALTNPVAVAFNTDNNVKSAIPDLKDCWPSERGTYIKKPANPQLDGYELIENCDISGSDICRFVMKDIQDMKRIADDNPWCLAFNTNGYFKFDNLRIIPSNGTAIYIKKNIDIPSAIIEGYRFYPYRDSYGNDIGRDSAPILSPPASLTTTNPLDYMNIENIKQLAEICSSKSDAVAFNLDGMIKNKVLPVDQLTIYPLYRLQGLFIKK